MLFDISYIIRRDLLLNMDLSNDIYNNMKRHYYLINIIKSKRLAFIFQFIKVIFRNQYVKLYINIQPSR